MQNELDIQRPRSWSVDIEGVGEVYECPKKCLFLVSDQMLFAWGKIPVELGKVVIHWYISVAWGRDKGKVRGALGGVPKRKVRSRGPRWPNGSIVKGISVMLLFTKSPRTPSPRMDDPVVGSHLFLQLSCHFSKTCRCISVLADKIWRTSGESRSKEGHGSG